MECLSQSEVLAVIFNNLTTKVSTLGPYKGTKKCTSLISFIKFWPSILDKEIKILTLCLSYWKTNCYQRNNVWSWPQHEHFYQIFIKIMTSHIEHEKKLSQPIRFSGSHYALQIIHIIFSLHQGYGWRNVFRTNKSLLLLIVGRFFIEQI